MNTAVEALLDVTRLKALGVVPHYFGLGFIQMKLDASTRLHVWVPDWPAIPGVDTELHDHRYAFESTVLLGAMEHEVFALGPVRPEARSGDWELLSVTCQPGEEGEPQPQGFVEALEMGRFRVEQGQSYRLGEEAFHRSKTDGPTVTWLRRGPVDKPLARVLRKPGSPFVCPFSLSPSVEECWVKVAQVLEAGRQASRTVKP